MVIAYTGSLVGGLPLIEDFHGLIRIKLVQFMESSSPCNKYVNNKTDQTMEEYLTQNNTIMSTVWGSDVEVFSLVIFLQTDVFVYISGIYLGQILFQRI